MWLDKVILQHALVLTNSGKKNLILKKKKIGTVRKKGLKWSIHVQQ